MNYTIRAMVPADYDAAIILWQSTEHMGLNECDTRAGIEFYLQRNPGLCFVAEQDGNIIGAVLCGHDARRGFLRHLAVNKSCRGYGIARALVDTVLKNLAAQGVMKCNIFVDDINIEGLKFWDHLKWKKIDDDFFTLQMMCEMKTEGDTR